MNRRRPPAYARDAAAQARIARKIAARAQVRRRDERLDAVDQCILSVLDERTLLGYGDGRMGVRQLAAQVHRTDRTVRRHLARLECLGYLEVQERCAGHGGPAVNRYRVRSPKGTERRRDAFERRRAARGARDAARKQRRPARSSSSGGGVLTPVAPAHTRGRVNARSGTGEQKQGRPVVPTGGGQREGGWVMPMRDGRWVSPVPGDRPAGRPVTPGRGRDAGPALAPVRAGASDPVERAAEVAAAQARIAELVARGSRASGWRR